MISKILCRLISICFILYSVACFSIEVKAQNNCIKYDIIGGNVPKGGTIWVPIRIYNFDSILGFQLGISYDPLVVKPTGNKKGNDLIKLDTSSNTINIDQKVHLIKVVWTELTNDCTTFLNDGDTLLMIEFKLIGEPGSCTTINITPNKIFTTEFFDCNVEDYCLEEINPQDNLICIGEPLDLCVISHACGTFTNTGTIVIKPFGGTAPYTLKFLNPPGFIDILDSSGSTKIYTNLFPGSYQIEVTDSTGKDTTLTVTVPFSNSIAIFPAGVIQPHCLNDSNGVIKINIIGGSGDLTIGWRPLNIYGTDSIYHLKVGTYTVVVTDTSGCQATEDFTLFADTLFTQVKVIKDASCSDDGIVMASASGGNPYPGGKYQFIWSQNPAADTIDVSSTNSKVSGKQFVTIIDSRMCQEVDSFEVKFSGDLLDSIVIDSIPCFDSTAVIHSFVSSKGNLNVPVAFVLTDHNGKAILGGANGVDNYISPKLKISPRLRDSFYLDIIDNAGCKRRDTIIITQPDLLQVVNVQLDTTESCSPGKDAFLIVRGFGGTPTYNFLWSNGVPSNSNDTLRQGNYTVTITDFNGCTAKKSYSVTQPIGPKIDSFNVSNPICQQDKNGSAKVNFTLGGAALKSIKWNTGGNRDTILNRGAGTYIVTITDQNGCTAIDSTSLIPTGNGLAIKTITLSDPRCHGSSDGFITVSLSSWQGIPTYLWDNGNQTSINTNLKAGKYCVHIADFGTCPAIDTCLNLIDPPKIDIQLTNVTAPSCSNAGTCDASAMVFATGRDSTYQIIWSSGEVTATRSDTTFKLCAGDQYVIVNNGNFCADTLLFKVPDAVPITIDSITKIPPRCYESNDGIITLLAIGGTGPYQYKWTNPVVNSPTIKNLGDGMYYVDIIDSKNCVHKDSVRLRQPDSIRVDIILGSTLDVTCPGKSDGRITTAWTGGNRGPASFTWTPPLIPSDSIATNLNQGKYILKVTDKNGCTGTNEYTILAPPPISFQITPIDTPHCENDQIHFSVLNAMGGTGALYRFTIDNGAPNNLNDIVPLYSGNYDLRIYDKNNCFIDTNIIVSNPTNILSLDFGQDSVTIALGDSVLLDGKLNSNVKIDSIIWNPSSSVSTLSSTSSFVRPSTTTLYVLSVIDQNGCQASDQIQVIVRNSKQFFAPNIFSPNGDNINDFFSLQLGQGVKAIKSLQIFDRWGNKVYNLEDPVIDAPVINTWNGRFGNTGDFMNPGVFVYLAEVVFQDGVTVVYRGDLTLVR